MATHAFPRRSRLLLALAACAFAATAACGASGNSVTGSTSGGGDTQTPSGGTSNSSGVPAPFTHFGDSVKVTVEGGYAVIRSNGVPNHKSPYFASSDPRHAAYSGTNPSFMQAPGQIVAESYTFRIPLTPTKATSAQATPLGPIGVSLNGVPFFNQYNGNHQPLGPEINTFDQYNGHPTPMGEYHYHAEPTFLTTAVGRSGLLGFLLDGYPVYGPVENGKTLASADLDAYHGHFGATADYPAGIYHYHVTADAPYINGSGFYGVPGTVGR
jgi:YHYH protein